MLALVVDDSRVLRKIIIRTLSPLGYDTVEAGDGQQALDVLANGPVPDLACVDWNMPVMDGLTFVGRVRAEPKWRAITLMMVTTESEYSQVVRALAAGAHEYLMKPFTAAAFIEKLDLLGLNPAARASVDAAEAP